mmetsp:Transcript_335/g.471  ORF Transcript_335/g.471 Transcript_335/m.471 type:complete len:152 (+) Transcript_335:116-571(+)
MESVLNNLLNGFNDDTNNLLQLNDDVADGYAALAPPASKSAIRELDDVDLENLTERDRRRMKNDKCPICDVDFTPKDVYCKRMPCGHLFHDQECLMPWLAKTNSCPLCRFELPTNNAMYEAKKREKNNVNSSENDGDFLLSSRHASQTQFI